MSRIDDDIRKIDQIIGENYTHKKGMAAFAMLVDGGDVREIRGGDFVSILAAAAEMIADVITAGVDDWQAVQTIHRGVAALMEEREKQAWEKKHGKAETAWEGASPEDQLAARIKGDATA